MNWIERLPEIKGKDLYSQNGEGLILEYIDNMILENQRHIMFDIGSGDGFILSNSRHIRKHGYKVAYFEKENGFNVTLENLPFMADGPVVVSIDIDGNDYWILDKLMERDLPCVVIAEFNPAFTDSRTIAYSPTHEWAGDDYYGFSFEAGEKLAEKHGYKVIWQIADMNMIMVRKDLIEGLYVPPVTFKQSNFFKKSERTDWIFI